MKEFVDNKYGQRKAQFFRDQVVSNAQAAMARMRADAVNNPEVFVDTPMAALGTSMYNGMSGQDILSMYDKKQKAYDSINPFNGLTQSFTDATKYFNDPKYFAHKQEFYINDDYAKGLSEDDIANAFMRKGIGSDMTKTVAYDYFNPQQTNTTDMSNMSPDYIKAMRQNERDNYRKMKQDQKDWFGSATYVGGYAPSYACGGIKKMAHGGDLTLDTGYNYIPIYNNNGELLYYENPQNKNRYYADGTATDSNGNKIPSSYLIHRNLYGYTFTPTNYNGSRTYTDELGNEYFNNGRFRNISSPTVMMNTPLEVLRALYGVDDKFFNNDILDRYKLSKQINYKNNKQDSGNGNVAAVTDTEVITGATNTGNNTGTISVNGTSTTDNVDTSTTDKDTSTGTGESTDSKTPSNGVTPPAAPDDTYGRSFINISTPWGTGRVFVDNNNIDVRRNGRRLAIWGDRNPSTYRVNTNYTPIKDYSYIPQDSKEITVPDNTSDIFYNTNNYWGSTPTVLYSNPLGNKRCGGVTKAALGMALIDDEKYDNGNMPNTPIGPVNPVSWEPMMTVDTTPSKEESTPQGSGMDSIADQADAATGIKNKNDYGYGISNAVWNGLMFAGNFAEKMRNDKNQLASVAARLNNTQDAQVAMRAYDPEANPTHLGFDPSRIAQLYTAKYGGRKYALGGVYDLTAKEIDEILKNGGKIEFIW